MFEQRFLFFVVVNICQQSQQKCTEQKHRMLVHKCSINLVKTYQERSARYDTSRSFLIYFIPQFCQY